MTMSNIFSFYDVYSIFSIKSKLVAHLDGGLNLFSKTSIDLFFCLSWDLLYIYIYVHFIIKTVPLLVVRC